MTTRVPSERAYSDWTVLLVEDRAELLELHREILASVGPRVVTAASGEEALARHESADPPVDAIFSDVDLPGISSSRTFPSTPMSLPNTSSHRA